MVANPKHIDVKIAVQQDESSQFSQSVQLCQQLIPNWAPLSASDVEVLLSSCCWTALQDKDWVADRGTLCKVAKVSGGITNLLLKLSPPDEHKPVLVRVFGDNTDIVIDREAEEIVSLQIYKAGFGAEVLLYNHYAMWTP